MKKSKPKVKEKKKDEENFDFMKTNKDNIKNVLKDPNILLIINLKKKVFTTVFVSHLILSKYTVLIITIIIFLHL